MEKERISKIVFTMLQYGIDRVGTCFGCDRSNGKGLGIRIQSGTNKPVFFSYGSAGGNTTLELEEWANQANSAYLSNIEREVAHKAIYKKLNWNPRYDFPEQLYERGDSVRKEIQSMSQRGLVAIDEDLSELNLNDRELEIWLDSIQSLKRIYQRQERNDLVEIYNSIYNKYFKEEANGK